MFQLDDDTLALMRQRWRSLKHVGDAKPYVRGWVRSGKLARSMVELPDRDIYSFIPNWQTPNTVWLGEWTPRSIYFELPPIQRISGTQNYSQNGLQQITIDCDNVALTEEDEGFGIFHMIERGYYAPFRGYAAPGRRKVGTKNDFFDFLNDESTEIVIVAGYGEDAAIPIFKGLVDDIDMTSRPDSLTLTARDMGKFLTDQYCAFNAKVRGMRDPITFADRRYADETTTIRGAVQSSGDSGNHPASYAVDNKDTTEWQSEPNDGPDAFAYIEMAVPSGRYESVKISPAFDGMECWIAVHAQDQGAPGGHGAEIEGGGHLEDGWVSLDKGHVPNTNIPFVKHISQLKGKNREYWFNGLKLGDDSRVRLYFSNLQRTLVDSERKYVAGVVEFAAIKRKLKDEAKLNKWILVNDASDVVRTVLQWVGFGQRGLPGDTVQWEVEDTGVRLADKIVFNRSNKLIEIITHIAELTNFVFFLKPPEVFDDDDLTRTNDNNLCMGIPCFRNNQAMRSARQTLEPVEQINEDRTLQGVSTKFSNGSLASVIRVRGKRLKKEDGGRQSGGDKSFRYTYVYTPPWGRNQTFQGEDKQDFLNGNLKRYVVHHDDMLDNEIDCKVMALFIAYREALEASKGTVECPLLPSVFLDSQTAIFDEGTGLSTRLYVAERQIDIQCGEQASSKMALGGSLIDLPDITEIREELVKALRDRGYDPGLSRWELRHYGSNWAGHQID